MVYRRICALLTLALVVTACSGPGSPEAPPVAQAVSEIASPAAVGSGEPNLTVGDDGRLYLSWIEPFDDGHALRFAVREGAGWSAPRTIATGRDWFVNWADFPALAALGDGTLAAHWLAKSGPGTYAYDVWLAVSRDGGETWSEPVRPHGDGTRTEHGFVSLVPAGDRFGVAWLDGRETAAQPPGPMTLRYTTLDREGRVGQERLIDERVCDCCQTEVVRTADGLAAFFRDRSTGEIRDIYVALGSGDDWSESRAVHDDGWKIAACPVNGPAAAASGDDLAVAWFTVAAGGEGQVKLTFSGDGGRSFGSPLRVDGGNPLGRVDLLLHDDGSALVSWLELGETAEIRVRRVEPSGALGEPRVAVTTSGARSSGFPRLARLGGEVFLAWTAAEEPAQVRTGVLR